MVVWGMTQKHFICDIDGTLSNLHHRLHYVNGKEKNWERFFEELPFDTRQNAACDLVETLIFSGMGPIFVSGRPERTRDQTITWLKENISNLPEDPTLYMRPDGDHRADHIIKKKILDSLEGVDIQFAIDDRPKVVEMWRENGIPVFQCEYHGNEKPKRDASLILMVGPSGAGKTTWLTSGDAMKTGVFAFQAISSDTTRLEMTGDPLNQEMNDQVFRYIHELVSLRLSWGLNTVIDATNIRAADRKKMVELAQGRKVYYIVINRPMEEKYRDAGWRKDLSFDLIKKHEDTFNSQLKSILAGDGFPNVTVLDMRKK